MIATPESGVDSIAVSWAMLDPIMTLIRPIAGFITAVSCGIVQNFFGTEEQLLQDPMPAQGCNCGSSICSSAPKENPSLLKRLKTGMIYAYTELLTDIAKPFVIGILIAGAITFLFPEDLTIWANQYPFLSMLVMLAAGIPMYVCATSSTPIAAALILKGLNPGAALVFLLAGPATNAATINIVKSLFNTRALIIYLSMIAVCSLGMGFLLDWMYAFFNIKASAVVGQAAELIPYSIKWISAIILTVLMLINGFLQIKKN